MIIFKSSPVTESFERSFLKSPGSSSRHHTHQPIKPQRNELSVVRLAAGGTAWTHEVRDCRKDAPKLGLLWRANEKACDEARAPIRQRRLKFPQGCTKAPVRNRSAHHRGVRKEYLPHLMRKRKFSGGMSTPKSRRNRRVCLDLVRELNLMQALEALQSAHHRLIALYTCQRRHCDSAVLLHRADLGARQVS